MENILRVKIVCTDGMTVELNCNDHDGYLASILAEGEIGSIHINGTRVRRETTVDRVINLN